MLAVTDVEAITSAVIGVFLLLALLTVVRVILKREDRWTRIRIGVFLEREADPQPPERGVDRRQDNGEAAP